MTHASHRMGRWLPPALVRGRQTRRDNTAALRSLMLGAEQLPAAWVPTSRLLRPVWIYLRVGAVFERHGLTAARQLLGHIRPGRSDRCVQDRAVACCARSAGWRILGLARTLGGRHLCLHEALGLCAALRDLGFAVQVVIGYPIIELASGEEELHAWPALGSIPLTGRSDGEPTTYRELYRFPDAPQLRSVAEAAQQRSQDAPCC